jgi:TonB-dependent SusC/RagA subfamily outer membrane receptor
MDPMNARIKNPKSSLLFVFLGLSVLAAGPAAAKAPGHPGPSSASGSPGDERNSVSSTLRSATVFRNGAELVHTASAILKQGTNELAIGDVSNNIDINSIRINCSRSVTIMSVEFSKEYLHPEILSATVRRLNDSLDGIRKATESIETLIRTDNDLLGLLASNKRVGGDQTGLNVAELIKMMDYYKQKTLDLHNDISMNQEKKSKLQNIISRLESQIEEEEKKNDKTSGRILLQLLSPEPGRAEFTVTYLTPTAYWNPAYDLKVENINSPLQLVYKAKLVQTSGIDWKQVKLTLSTSLADKGGNAPVLSTWFLSLANPIVRGYGYLNNQMTMNSIQSFGAPSKSSWDYKSGLPGAYKKVIIRGQGSDTTAYPLYIIDGRPADPEEVRNLNADDIKAIDVLKDEQATALYGSRGANGVIVITLKNGLGDYVSMKDNEMNVVFNIAIPYDVPGNGKVQNVELQQNSIPAMYKYYSAPRVDKDAYLLCELSDWGKLNLLPGEANILFEGTYIGKSYIDPNSTRDTLNLTLGNDKRLVVSREKLVDYSSVKFLGANKRQVFTYDITVKNNKKEKVLFLLKDQYPISTTKEIETELLDSDGAMVNSETGILTWKMELAPGESRKYRFSYSEKFPKDRDVSSR